jgi:hypothetical protein
VSNPSEGPQDVQPPPAQEKNLDQQVQPEGQAVAQKPPDGADESAGSTMTTGADATADADEGATPSASADPAAAADTTADGGATPTAGAGPTAGPAASTEGDPTVDTGRTAASGSTAPSAPPSTTDADPIADAIDKLRAEIQGARDKKVSAESAFTDVEGRLKTLETVHKDADATVAAYTSAYDALAADDIAYTEYLEREEDSLATSLGDAKVDKVKQLVRESQERGDRLEREVTTATERLTAAEKARDRRKSEAKAAADLLTAWRKLGATLSAQHTELKKMRDDVTKARQAGQYGLALHLLRRAKRRRKQLVKAGPTLTPPAEVRGALVKAVAAVGDAEKALADAERTVAARKERLAIATKKRDEHRLTAEATLREDLVKVTTGDAVTTGGTDNA